MASNSAAPSSEVQTISAPVVDINGRNVVAFGGLFLDVVSKPSSTNPDRIESIWNNQVYEIQDSMKVLGSIAEEAKKVVDSESVGAGVPSIDVDLLHALLIQSKEIERLRGLLAVNQAGQEALKGDGDTMVKVVKTQWKPGMVLSASFVEDVTIPDGTKVKAGVEFVKRWKFRNNGHMWWPLGCAFKHKGDSGSPFTTQKLVSIAEEVAPGATIEVSVKMKAPAFPSSTKQQSFWQFCDPSGSLFGAHCYAEILVTKS
jgi:hypothetical protein